jgi:hypothetical protein
VSAFVARSTTPYRNTMRTEDGTDITPHDDINAILNELAVNLRRILGPQLFGLYLTGSLTYCDIDRGSSDIDFLAILGKALTAEQLDLIKQVHGRIGERYPLWAERIEGSYITSDMLGYVEPPPVPGHTSMMERFGIPTLAMVMNGCSISMCFASAASLWSARNRRRSCRRSTLRLCARPHDEICSTSGSPSCRTWLIWQTAIVKPTSS